MLGEIPLHIPVRVKLIGGTIILIKIHRDPVDKIYQGKFRIISLNQEVVSHDCLYRHFMIVQNDKDNIFLEQIEQR